MRTTSRNRWLLAILPMTVLLMAMDRIEEPQYYMDSNRDRPSEAQSVRFSEYGRAPQSAAGMQSEALQEPIRPTMMPKRVAYNYQQREIASFDQSRSEMSTDRGSVGEISPQQAHKYGVQEFSIIATKDGYFPKSLVVRKNIPVNLYLTTTESRDLCFIMKGDDFSIHKGVGSKDIVKVSFEPRRTGPYRFHCPINNLAGTLIVRD